MSGEIHPTWLQKVNALRDACAWATGTHGDWAYRKEAFGDPDDNDPWFELRMGRMRELGVDDLCYIDNGIPAGDPGGEEPRQDMIVGQRQFFVELRTFNRDQEQDVVAWVVAERARTRMRLPYVRERFLNPVSVTLAELFEVVPMPSPRAPVELRWQSEAVLEMDFATVVAETDAAAVGTWIESVRVSSDLKNCAGVSLDPSIQLDNEVMP